MAVAVAGLDQRRAHAISRARDRAGKRCVLDTPPDKNVLAGLNVGTHLNRELGQTLKPIFFVHQPPQLAGDDAA
jgi:hypothetical protein